MAQIVVKSHNLESVTVYTLDDMGRIESAVSTFRDGSSIPTESAAEARDWFITDGYDPDEIPEAEVVRSPTETGWTVVRFRNGAEEWIGQTYPTYDAAENAGNNWQL